MTKIIAVSNQKGGVGKTTSAVNLAAVTASFGFKTLLIDLDPQSNASSAFGIYADSQGLASSYDLLNSTGRQADILQQSEIDNLKICPSSQSLSGLEVELVSAMNRERRLQKSLEGIASHFDFIFIDTPPTLGLITINALTAADSVLVPMQAEYYALEGLSQLVNTIELVKDHLNHNLTIELILITMFDGRNNLAKQVRAEINNHFGEFLAKVSIPRNIKLSEAPSYGKPIILYDLFSKGSIAYLQAGKELLLNNGCLLDEKTLDRFPLKEQKL